MNKVIIFSHESDIDGLGAIVLGKLSFSDIDYELFHNIFDLEIKFRKYIENGKLKAYEHIYITDLALYEPSLSMVNSDLDLKRKVLVFDHHKRAIDDGCDKFEFTKIMENDSIGKKRCGTELFYEYLLSQKLIEPNQAISDFVECTRLEDTWQWQEKGEFGIKAHDLAILLSATSKNEYITSMVKKLSLNKNRFELTESEKNIVQIRKDEYNSKISGLLSQAEQLTDEFSNKFLILFADYEYRNEIAEYIIKIGNPVNVKYVIIVALNKGEFGQKSYRSISKDFDVNEISKYHGGGGHKGASAVNITKEQKETALKLSKKEALEYLAKSKFNC